MGHIVEGGMQTDRGNHVISPWVDGDPWRTGTIPYFVCLFAPEEWAHWISFSVAN